MIDLPAPAVALIILLAVMTLEALHVLVTSRKVTRHDVTPSDAHVTPRDVPLSLCLSLSLSLKNERRTENGALKKG